VGDTDPSRRNVKKILGNRAQKGLKRIIATSSSREGAQTRVCRNRKSGKDDLVFQTVANLEKWSSCDRS